MSGPAAHIHLKEGEVPKVRHNPIPVPFHFKESVRQALWEDMKRSIITPVPVGMPTVWCSTMVITAKKKWQATKNNRLPTLELTVQMRDTPHGVTVPASTTGVT